MRVILSRKPAIFLKRQTGQDRTKVKLTMEFDVRYIHIASRQPMFVVCDRPISKIMHNSIKAGDWGSFLQVNRYSSHCDIYCAINRIDRPMNYDNSV